MKHCSPITTERLLKFLGQNLLTVTHRSRRMPHGDQRASHKPPSDQSATSVSHRSPLKFQLRVKMSVATCGWAKDAWSSLVHCWVTHQFFINFQKKWSLSHQQVLKMRIVMLPLPATYSNYNLSIPSDTSYCQMKKFAWLFTWPTAQRLIKSKVIIHKHENCKYACKST